MSLSKIPEIAEMQKEVGVGRCFYCTEPLPEREPQRGRVPIRCDDRECERAYYRAARNDCHKRARAS